MEMTEGRIIRIGCMIGMFIGVILVLFAKATYSPVHDGQTAIYLISGGLLFIISIVILVFSFIEYK